MTLSRRSSALGPSLILTAWAASCSDPAAAPAGPVLRLVPRPVAAAPAWPRPKVRLRSEPLKQVHRWRPYAPTVLNADRGPSEAPYGSTPKVLVLGGENEAQTVRITCAGKFDPSQFNEVEIVAGFFGRGRLTVTLLRDGDALARSTVPIEPGYGQDQVDPRHVRVLPFPVPDAVRAAGAFDHVEVRYDGKVRALRLHALALIDRPPESLLPDPHGDAQPISAGGDVLRGWGLSSRVPLAAPLEGGRGALVFSYAVPARVVVPDDAELVVTLRAEDGEATATRLALPAESGWHTAHAAIGDLALTSAQFHLESAAGTVAACAIADVVLVPDPDAAAPPTVILISTDTHRGDHLGRAKDGVPVDTPVLDDLADRGALFERCFTWTNVTNPSHIALMTGRHPRDVGVLNNHQRLANAAETLAESFRERGYTTWASVSAFHLATISGLHQGFDRLSGPERGQRRAAPTVDHALGWRAARAGRPLFLWLHVFDAHWPYDPPEEFTPPLPTVAEPLPEPLRADLEDALHDVGVVRAKYRGEVAYLDRHIGRLLAELGGAEPWIAFVGDHGESFGAHGYYYTHAGLYPQTLHVPLIVAGPGVAPGERVERLVPQADVGRTLLDLAGLSSAPFPGTNLLDRAAVEGTDAPLFALHSHGTSASVTKDGYHLVLHLEGRPAQRSELEARVRHAVELYHLATDPDCAQNVVAEELERARTLRRTLLRWLESAQDLGWADAQDLDADSLRRLQALGYTGDGPAAAELWRPDRCEWCQRFR
ncbi:MAG: sulfatase [Planctomycetota bacterium]